VEVRHDPYGHVRLEEIHPVLRREIQRRFAERNEELPVVETTLGYGLRSAAPVPFDIDYTRSLGYGAVSYLMDESSEEILRVALICIEDGSLRALPLQELRDPNTCRTRVSVVDIDSDYYTSARQYMIRLEKQDLEDLEMAAKLAVAANLTQEEFATSYLL